MATGRLSFTPQFERDTAALVVEQGYLLLEACKAINMGETAMRRCKPRTPPTVIARKSD